jgi:hypothetical protein
MLSANRVEDLACRPRAASVNIVKALPYSLGGIRLSGQVKETLIGLGILDHCSRLPIHGQDHGAFGFFEVLHHFGGMVAKRRHRLNVFGDVHGVGPP